MWLWQQPKLAKKTKFIGKLIALSFFAHVIGVFCFLFMYKEYNSSILQIQSVAQNIIVRVMPLSGMPQKKIQRTVTSMMPQKKNPDVPELVRGKTGRVNGHVVSLLTLMKGQPLAYNKDNQEDKEPLFDTAQTIRDTLLVYADMLTGITVNKQAMRDATARGFATATDLADHLVRQGLPFRESHEVVAKAVKTASQQNVDITDLAIEELQAISPLISKEMVALLSPEQALESRNHIGGTGSQAVMSAISNARKLIA